jgi:hypothetical protein
MARTYVSALDLQRRHRGARQASVAKLNAARAGRTECRDRATKQARLSTPPS